MGVVFPASYYCFNHCTANPVPDTYVINQMIAKTKQKPSDIVLLISLLN